MMKCAVLPLAIAFLCHAAGAQEVIEVRALSIPGAGEDYAPVWLDSGFVMSSVREVSGAIDFRDADSGKPLSDLYWVPYQDETCRTPVLFSAILASPVNEGPASFSADGRTICYTRNLELPKKLSNLRGKAAQLGLFFSTLQDGSWQPPVPFPFNAVGFSTMHPTLSPDGRTLIFASNAKEGAGMDLYFSVFEKDGWTAPEALNGQLNTTANEVYPQLQPDGSLIFASDRAGGLGGLDLYRSERYQGRWTRPELLPAPINSAANDVSYSGHRNGRSALFVSDREGADRIYHMERTVPKFRECTAQKEDNFCYRFAQRERAVPAGLPLDHVWDLGDGNRITGLVATHCFEHPGSYEIKSMLVDRKTGQVFHTLSNEVLHVEKRVQAYIAIPDTVRTGRPVVLRSDLSHTPHLQPMEYHWDLGDGTQHKGRTFAHSYKAPGTYTLKLDVLGQPDADGVIRNACNTRAIVVLDRYRDQEDQSVAAIFQDAFGNQHAFSYQELPFDMTELSMDLDGDGTFAVQLFATRERMSLDDPRFAEIRKVYPVVERFDPVTATYIYYVGEARTMEEMYAVYKKVKELQFLEAEVFALTEEQLVDLSQLDLSSLADLNNKKVRTSAIHFAYKSAVLDSTSHTVLEQMQRLLQQHANLSLVIEAHTDDIGSRSYNLDLSQQRANSVVEFLAERGVPSERLVPIGHGKNQPIASNKSENGRAKNRRVEFRMVVKDEAAAILQRHTP
ncbi:MAG: PKD domain-containing protein [Flavobacteriales bacterium]